MSSRSVYTTIFTCDLCGDVIEKKTETAPVGWRKVIKSNTSSYYNPTCHDVCKACFSKLDPEGKLTPKKKTPKKGK
jgi:hypothetical protein